MSEEGVVREKRGCPRGGILSKQNKQTFRSTKASYVTLPSSPSGRGLSPHGENEEIADDYSFLLILFSPAGW